MKKYFLLILCLMPLCLLAQTYKMYQTRNYHNQLRLNTATGEVLQVQDDVNHGKFVMRGKKAVKLITASVFMKHRICGLFLCLILLPEKIGRFNLVQKVLIICLLHQLITGQKHFFF